MLLNGNKFFFVRHAESLWNRQHLCQGTQDIDLSERGVEAALAFSKSLAKFPVECICSSPLLRARRTAEMIRAFHPISKYSILDELKERHWGELEGKSSVEMYKIEEQEEDDELFFAGRGIETRKEFKKRIISGINQAFEIHPAPLIVSHGRLFLVLCELLNIPTTRQVSNLELIQFEKIKSEWKVSRVLF